MPEISCMKRTSVHIKNMCVKQVSLQSEGLWDFSMTYQVRKHSGAFDKMAWAKYESWSNLGIMKISVHLGHLWLISWSVNWNGSKVNQVWKVTLLACCDVTSSKVTDDTSYSDLEIDAFWSEAKLLPDEIFCICSLFELAARVMRVLKSLKQCISLGQDHYRIWHLCYVTKWRPFWRSGIFVFCSLCYYLFGQGSVSHPNYLPIVLLD